jgi:hypothetical protein
MAFTLSPLYGQAGSYTAQQDRLNLQAMTITGGVRKLTAASSGVMTGDLAVTTTGAGNASVNVAAGQVVIPWTAATNQGNYLAYNDASTVVGSFAACPTNTRIDLVVVTVTDTGSASPSVAFAITQGTAAASPTAPATPANSIVLASVLIPTGFTTGSTIAAGSITDLRRKAFLPDLSITAVNSTTVPSPTHGNVAYVSSSQNLATYNALAGEGAKWETIPPSTAFRNIVTNGTFVIAQRPNAFSLANVNQMVTDRWSANITAAGTFDVTSATVPTAHPLGLTKDLSFQCTAGASLGATSLVRATQLFENTDLQNVYWGTANAKKLTLSFWVYASLTGNFIAELYDGSKSVSALVTINSANTWEWKTVTFPAPTNATHSPIFSSSRNVSLNIVLTAGSNFTSGTLATTWQTTTSANRYVGANINFGTTSANFQITGVQLETGEVASQLENRPINLEEIMCQRFYQKLAANTMLGTAGSTTQCVLYVPEIRWMFAISGSFTSLTNAVYNIIPNSTHTVTVGANAIYQGGGYMLLNGSGFTVGAPLTNNSIFVLEGDSVV